MRQSHARIQATITGKARKQPISDHERTVMAVSRRITTLERERGKLHKRLRDIAMELRHKRREFRALLQRDSSITTDDERLTTAGKADAIDATEARAESG